MAEAATIEAPAAAADGEAAITAAFDSAPSTPADTTSTTTTTPAPADAGQPAEDLETDAQGADAGNESPASDGGEASTTDAQPASSQPDATALFARLESLLAGDKPAEQAQAQPEVKAEQPKQPASPANTADPFSPILDKARAEFGDEMADGVVKPLVEHFKAETARQVAEVTKQFAPVAQVFQQMRLAEAQKAAEDHFGRHAAIYGKDHAERTKNPAMLQAVREDIDKAAKLQGFYESKGERLSDGDALFMATAMRTKTMPVSQAREQVKREMQGRDRQRTVPPGKTVKPAATNWQQEVEQNAAKFYED